MPWHYIFYLRLYLLAGYNGPSLAIAYMLFLKEPAELFSLFLGRNEQLIVTNTSLPATYLCPPPPPATASSLAFPLEQNSELGTLIVSNFSLPYFYSASMPITPRKLA